MEILLSLACLWRRNAGDVCRTRKNSDRNEIGGKVSKDRGEVNSQGNMRHSPKPN